MGEVYYTILAQHIQKCNSVLDILNKYIQKPLGFGGRSTSFILVLISIYVSKLPLIVLSHSILGTRPSTSSVSWALQTVQIMHCTTLLK